jgi:hypothetical protein
MCFRTVPPTVIMTLSAPILAVAGALFVGDRSKPQRSMRLP